MSNKPLSVNLALVKAETFAKRGAPDQAMQLYQAVLERFPGNKRAIEGLKSLERPTPDRRRSGFNTGPTQEQINGLMALYSQGRFQEVLEQGTALARQYPDVPLIPNILGAANADTGRLEEAVTNYSKALQLKPDYAEAHNNLGNVLAALGKHEEAIASLTRALQLKSDYAAAHNNLGNVLNDLGRHDEAIACLTKALQLRPNFAEAHNNLGNALKGLGKSDEAIACYSRALELKPGNVEARSNLGDVLNDLGRHDEAIASLTKALQLRPKFAEAHCNLGIALAALGKNDEAIASYSRALELKPDYVRAYYHLALAHRFQPRDPLIKELNRQLARQPRDGGGRIFLLEALGKAHDDLRLYDKAFGYYRKANQESAKRVSFDQVAQREQIEAIKSAFPQPLLCPDRSPGAVIPIFVVGMSRAGKTLVESLLAQHPAVIGAGERREWSQALDRVLEKSGIADTFPACLGSLTPVQIREVGEHYLDEFCRRRQLPGGRFYINTLPGHYRYLGLIFRAFPSVKVIYCQRQPLDQCLSIYFKFFANGHAYSYDLEDLAACYVNYQDMMAHWMRLYDERILTVQYETLVRKPLEVGRGLYAHCGLDFPPAMFHADFRTDQIGHARHYERQLAPLRAALRH